MTNDIKISRELIKDLHEHPDCPVEFIDHLRRALAAPVVERQEPVGYGAWNTGTNPGTRLIRHDDLVAISPTPSDFYCIPVYTSPPAPVAADIAHDRAYLNGLMAGFQFGISGNEKGYALAVSNLNSEIHQAKKDQPATVAVALPEPFAWHTEDYLTDKSATTYDMPTADRCKAKDWPVQPLYISTLIESAKAFAKGFNTLETIDGKYKIVMQFAGRDDAWAAYTELSQMTACLDKVKELNQ